MRGKVIVNSFDNLAGAIHQLKQAILKEFEPIAIWLNNIIKKVTKS